MAGRRQSAFGSSDDARADAGIDPFADVPSDDDHDLTPNKFRSRPAAAASRASGSADGASAAAARASESNDEFRSPFAEDEAYDEPSGSSWPAMAPSPAGATFDVTLGRREQVPVLESSYAATSVVSIRASTDSVRIAVGDPRRVGHGADAFVQYTVQTSPSLALGFPPNGASVRRRFRDFLWLHRQLRTSYLGVIVPPIPEKMFLGRFHPELIEYRRRCLERFLARVSVHDSLRGSSVLASFLCDAELPSAKSVREDLVEGFKSLSLRSMVSKTVSDGKYDAARAQTTSRGSAYVNLKAASEVAVNVYRHDARTLTALANAAGALADVGGETAAGATADAADAPARPWALGATMLRLGEIAAASAAHVQREQHEFGKLLLVDAITEAARMMLEARRAIDTRDRLCSVVAKAEAAVEAQQVDGSGASEAARESALEAATIARQQFARVDAMLSAELQRCESERVADVREALAAYVRQRCELHAEAGRIWRGLRTQLGRL